MIGSACGRQQSTLFQKNRQRWAGLQRAVLLPALLLVATLVGGCRNSASPPAVPLWSPPRGARPVAAVVTFTGTQVVVENPTTDLWREVEVTVGREGHPPAFRCRVEAILGGRSVAVGALHFERPDGTRLSPFQLQPDRWAVLAHLGDGTRGYAEGRF